jgi:diketogulonate reductase-like aldo/keto reductase
MEINATPTTTLKNGIEIPILGLGTYRALGNECVKAVKFALNHGYAMVDTAQAYDNERQVGEGWKVSGRTREDVFITTKIRNANQGHASTLNSFKTSLENLQTDTVDLLLIHWPNIQDFDRTIATWQAMIKLYEDGFCRSIGVSNFTIPLLEKLSAATDVIPMVNQVEFHPFLFQKELLAYCHRQGIQLEAYTPITRGKFFDHKGIQQVAKKHQKTPAQVMLAWSVQHNIVVIPKSVHEGRILENSDIFFELDTQDMEILDHLQPQTRLIDSPNAPPSW